MGLLADKHFLTPLLTATGTDAGNKKGRVAPTFYLLNTC